MTIAAGILCPDGVVLCADMQETIGEFKRLRPKLQELQLSSPYVKAVAVGSTQDSIFLDGLIEKISEAIDLSDGHLSSVRQAIEKSVRKYCKDILHLYASQNDRPVTQILIGLKTIDALALLDIYTPNVSNVSHFEFIGTGYDLAGYKAKQFLGAKMPVDVAAGIAAYILEVVKDNNIHCGGPTEMTLIRADGTIDHKSHDFCRRAGSTLRIWDYYANRLGSIIPLLSIGGRSATDMLLDAESDQSFLNDDKFERLLFSLIESRIGGELISVEDWATQLAVVTNRGAVNVPDANTYDVLIDTKAVLEKSIDQWRTGLLAPNLKEPVNALIHKHNETLSSYLRWRELASSHKSAFNERNSLNKLLSELNELLVKFIQLQSEIN